MRTKTRMNRCILSCVGRRVATIFLQIQMNVYIPPQWCCCNIAIFTISQFYEWNDSDVKQWAHDALSQFFRRIQSFFRIKTHFFFFCFGPETPKHIYCFAIRVPSNVQLGPRSISFGRKCNTTAFKYPCRDRWMRNSNWWHVFVQVHPILCGAVCVCARGIIHLGTLLHCDDMKTMKQNQLLALPYCIVSSLRSTSAVNSSYGRPICATKTLQTAVSVTECQLETGEGDHT